VGQTINGSSTTRSKSIVEQLPPAVLPTAAATAPKQAFFEGATGTAWSRCEWSDGDNFPSVS
jgi:hypothetical protein